MQKVVVTKSGFDPLTETNPDNMIFSSDYNTLKYYLSGDGSITIIGDTTDKITTVEVNHNLGYVPFFITFVDFFTNTTTALYQLVPHINNAPGRIVTAQCWADSSKLYIQLRNKSSNTYTAHFYYKIFRNNLNL